MEEIRFNLAAPDLLCICVDDRQHGENSGRVYCCYSREAMYFAHEYQLIKIKIFIKSMKMTAVGTKDMILEKW